MKSNKTTEQLLEEMGEIFFLEDNNTPHIFSEKYTNQKENILSKQSAFKAPNWRNLLNVAAILIGIICLVPVTVLGAQLIKKYITIHQDTGKYQDEYNFEKNINDSSSTVIHVKMRTDFPIEYENTSEYLWETTDGKSLSLSLLYAKEYNTITLQNVTSQKDLILNGYSAVYSTLHVVNPDNAGVVYDKNMLIFFEDKGYAVELYGTSNISEEEFLSLAEKIHLDETTYNEADKAGYIIKGDSPSYSQNSNISENYFEQNEFFEIAFHDYNRTNTFSKSTVSFTVTNAKIVPALSDLENGYLIGIAANTLKSTDATLPDYTRTLVKSGDGINTLDEATKTQTVSQNLIVVTCEFQNNTEKDMNLSLSPTMQLYSKKEADLITNGYHYNRGNNQLQPNVIWMDSISRTDIMLSDTITAKENTLYIPAQDTITVNMAFVMDSDLLDEVIFHIAESGGTQYFVPINLIQ